MDAATLEKIRSEIESALRGRNFGKIFSLSRFEIAIDFRLSDSTFLFISIEPADPRIYLIKRRLKDLEKLSSNPPSFIQYLRKRLSGAELHSIDRLPDERILRFELSTENELGEAQRYSLIAQLTGRSANVFLLDGNRFILDASRETFAEGQRPGDVYSPPIRHEIRKSGENNNTDLPPGFNSLSEALDSHYLEKAAERKFQSQVNSAQSKLKQEISKREKLTKKLNGDLAGHGDADKWKRLGDLLLANVGNARREGNNIFVTDYYDEKLPEVEIEVDENTPITEAAEKFFKRYTKAKNAAQEIAKRLKLVEAEIEKLKRQKQRLDEAIDAKDEDYLASATEDKSRKPTEKSRGKPVEAGSGSRSFISSDGFEILVGKKAKDNDFLTFRIAKSLDLWMHAADYPGSHVVVRNPNRKEIPNQTLLEAARIAAFYSQAKSQAKVAVHYTQKKFVNKPKGSAAGLVSLARFKTILVEPKIPLLLRAETRQ